MKLLGEPIDVTGNARHLYDNYRPFLWLLLFTAALDVLSTIAFMSTAGIEREYNWIVRVLSGHLGSVAGPVVGKVFQLVAVWALTVITPKLSRFICTVAILVNLLAFVLNMYAFVLG